MTIAAKICGLSTAEAVREAVTGGAAFVGFVFFPPSPRNVTPEQAARLAVDVPDTVKTVAVFVDPSDEDIASVLAAHTYDYLQLHGSETPARVQAVRARFNCPVIKAIPVSGPQDIENAAQYSDVADMLLFDAKAPKSMADALPGGNGLRFDWELLASSWTGTSPWILSGGLDSDSLADAIRISGAPIVDVSSGVEDGPGKKSLARIGEFLGTVRLL